MALPDQQASRAAPSSAGRRVRPHRLIWPRPKQCRHAFEARVVTMRMLMAANERKPSDDLASTV